MMHLAFGSASKKSLMGIFSHLHFSWQIRRPSLNNSCGVCPTSFTKPDILFSECFFVFRIARVADTQLFPIYFSLICANACSVKAPLVNNLLADQKLSSTFYNYNLTGTINLLLYSGGVSSL